MRADVAVIGIGAMGSGALWQLAARGATVIAFEQFEPGHEKGSSHGGTRLIRTAYYESPHYVPLVQRAFELWRDLERQTNTPLLTMTGALMIGQPDTRLVSGSLTSAREHNLAHEVLDAGQISIRFPQHRLADGEIALYEEQAGILRPEEGISTMVQQAERLGASVRLRTPVTAIEADGNGVRVIAGGDTYGVRHAVVATGPWLPAFLPAWNIPLAVERHIFAWFPVRNPASFAADRCPPFMHEISPEQIRYGIPSLDEATMKVGIHHSGIFTTAGTVDRAVHAHDVEPVQRYIKDSLTDVEPVAARTKVCLYTTTPDYHFVIGSPPDLPAVTVLSVCSGHGFKYAPVAGEIAADLVLNGRTDHPIDLFAPERFDRRAAARAN